MIKQKITFTFSKKGLMRFISHLDLMRLFQRASRRASLPIAMSEGFSPRPKMSFQRALKLGLESDNEEASFLINGWMKPQDFQERLQRELPVGVVIKNIRIG